MTPASTPRTIEELMGPQAPAHMRRLREEQPVCPVKLPNGDEALLVTRYDDVAAVLSDPRFNRTFNPRGTARAGDRATPPADLGQITRTLGMDGPPHRTLRAVVSRAFTPRRVESLRPAIQKHTDTLIDDLRRHGSPADLVSVVASPLPIRVICELLGVPHEDSEKFRGWSDRTLSVTSYPREEVVTAWHDLFAYFGEQVARKREHPGDDLLSDMVAASDKEERLTELELVYLATGLLIGGHESTINAISLGMWRLLEHPAEVARIHADPSLIVTAVEELLRFQTLGDIDRQRFTQEDLELGGTPIQAGQMVMAGVLSANRDERYFTDPDRLDVARHPNPHLSFGLGPHFCLGAALARVELQIVLGTLLREFPGMRLAVPTGQVRRKTGLMVSGLEELPVAW
ncbi:cytochrome P450 [Sphaerisporangium sp. NPDC049002]|uniref:cytochrome P450 n=1 Tax=unclassified Sphaerisporangium TaxID=2630420 RepID=UPI0033DC67F9